MWIWTFSFFFWFESLWMWHQRFGLFVFKLLFYLTQFFYFLDLNSISNEITCAFLCLNMGHRTTKNKSHVPHTIQRHNKNQLVCQINLPTIKQNLVFISISNPCRCCKSNKLVFFYKTNNGRDINLNLWAIYRLNHHRYSNQKLMLEEVLLYMLV